MQFRKSHIPLVPRTVTYSCSLTNKSPRKKAASTQTDKCLSPFENWFNSNQIPKDEFTFNEETTKAYSMALDYVNSFHSYMNKKLSEKYGECGDTKPEGSTVFKLPDVPNYATVFLMLLEKTKEPKLVGNNRTALKKKAEVAKSEVLPKKYSTKESVIEFVPEIKQLVEYKILEQSGALEEMKVTEAQKAGSLLRDDESVTYPSNTLSDPDDLSSFCSKKSTNTQMTPSEEFSNLETDKIDLAKLTPNNEKIDEFTSNNQEMDKEEKLNNEETEDTGLPSEDTAEKQVEGQSEQTSDSPTDDEKSTMMDIIKRHVQEEISIFFDKSKAAPMKTEQRPARLMKSHFQVVTIPPQINLLDYAQKKLERQLTNEPRPPATVGNSEVLPKQLFANNSTSQKKPISIRPSTPKKVRNMFMKFSQDNFNTMETAFQSNCESKESDGDSVILDDEEFEKINGYVDEHNDKKQKRCNSAGREKSNPLKLTVRDMTKVNEKMLSAIGLFTERGDIRPGVIDILEEQKRAKAKDARNKQFRSRRQWDLQVHLNPKDGISSSLTSISTENAKSFISLSSTDLRSDFGTVKNITQQHIKYDE